MDRKNAAAATAKREAEEAAAAKGSEGEDAGEPEKKKMVADGYGDGDDSEAEKISEKLTAEQREKLAKAAASKAGEEEEDGEHHTINLFNNEIKVPKKLTVPTPSPKPKKKYKDQKKAAELAQHRIRTIKARREYNKWSKERQAHNSHANSWSMASHGVTQQTCCRSQRRRLQTGGRRQRPQRGLQRFSASDQQAGFPLPLSKRTIER